LDARNDTEGEVKERNQWASLGEKFALITGGISGIGLATAKRFVREGAYVFITGRRESELAEAVREIGCDRRGARTLAEEFFTDELADLGSKDAAIQTRGVWIAFARPMACGWSNPSSVRLCGDGESHLPAR
jgi:NAD(P)-dependent dehydrogenase (short-subunit alcohol dehydrogenase family)